VANTAPSRCGPPGGRRKRRLVGSPVAYVVHDSLTYRAYREAFGIPIGDPLLAAQGPNRDTLDVRPHDVFFADVVGDSVIVIRRLETRLDSFLGCCHRLMILRRRVFDWGETGGGQ
jgi:bifunctional DNA-binding transcriptional regulator/antitoxin component of YhaV-PrlF toxin-antitoxin module